MTTRKPYHATQPSVAFERPTVGPRVYVAKGPSGWPETFVRKSVDKALIDFLAPLNVEELISLFATGVKLEAREETWGDVIDFLSRVTSKPTKLIPDAISVAFWATYLLLPEDTGAMN
jgi:hypothetical protein